MKECILGISSFGHDTSACLIDVSTSKTIFASAQERFSNIKFDDTIPLYTITECLKYAKKFNFNIKKAAISCDYNFFLGDYFFNEINKIIKNQNTSKEYFFFLKQYLSENENYINYFFSKQNKVDSYIRNNLNFLAKEKKNNLRKLNSWYLNWAIKHKKIHNLIQKFLGNIELIPVGHHLAHAASTFFSSGFDSSNIIVIDGQGEQDTITVYNGSKRSIKLISKTSWPNSLGMFYLAGTTHLGYKLGDEYKVMGMSAYGSNKFVKYFDPSFKINNLGELNINESDYIKFHNIPGTFHKTFSFSEKFSTILPRQNNKNFNQEHFDFAKSIQTVTESMGIDLSDWAYQKTKLKKLCLAGGVALNGLMNNKILNSNYIEDAFVYPASGDDGTSVGAALYVLSTDKNYSFENNKLNTCFFGFKDDDKKIETSHSFKHLNVIKNENPYKFISEKLTKDKIVAIFNSGAEFGPRSLGARSILANPSNPKMKEILNKKIKLREPFRPFAPVCLKEKVKDFFEIKVESNFMLFICNTKKEKIQLIPSVVHVDGTARVQSVDKENSVLFKILSEFYDQTNIPVLINTSFNIGGEAIVNTVEDAINSFLRMDIDYLIIDKFVISKNDDFPKNKISVNDFIKNRQKKFIKQNLLPSYRISYYNSNFYINFKSFIKKKLKEIFYIKYYL